jgi:hypothetical protein
VIAARPLGRTADPYRDLDVIDARAPRFNQEVVGLGSLLAALTGWWPLLAVLFDSPFDESVDEYSDMYSVYRLSLASADGLQGRKSWADASTLGTLVATVPVAAVQFDASKRESLKESIFGEYSIR